MNHGGLAFPPEGSAAPALNVLAQGAQAGDPETVATLLRAVAPFVRQTCRGVLGAQHVELEDAIQDSLIAIVRALPAWRLEGEFIHYATKISLRTAISTRRRVRQRPETVELSTVHQPSIEAAASVGDTEEQTEQVQLLRLLIRALADEQAEVLMLRFVFGYSLEETAKITEVPVNTAKTRIRLAKTALRRKIAANPRAFFLFGASPK